ncbi:MAG: AbrB/MazE/SpoVT family DNA-binding domain-containing protein [Nanoarchaeota archaeon]
MLEVRAKVREWGRSLGVVLPKESAKQEGIGKNDSVTLLITKKRNALRETFGTLKFKKATEQILKESDEEAWDE